MPIVEVICDRCGKKTKGLDNLNGTVSFYRVEKGEWKKYRRGSEKVVCDHCMLGDPAYVRDYASPKGGSPGGSSSP